MSVSASAIAQVLRRFVDLHGAHPKSLLPSSALGGKMYEARVLVWLLKELRTRGYRIHLIGGTKATLRWQGGYLKRSYSHFLLMDKQQIAGEIWTDLWVFSRVTHARNCTSPGAWDPVDYRELDILILKGRDAPDGNPVCHERIALGIECKSGKTYAKDEWTEILGMRLMLSAGANPPLPVSIRWNPSWLAWDPPSVLIAAAPPQSGLLAFTTQMVGYGIQAQLLKEKI